MNTTDDTVTVSIHTPMADNYASATDEHMNRQTDISIA